MSIIFISSIYFFDWGGGVGSEKGYGHEVLLLVIFEWFKEQKRLPLMKKKTAFGSPEYATPMVQIYEIMKWISREFLNCFIVLIDI